MSVVNFVDPAFVRAFQAGDHAAFKRVYDYTIDYLYCWLYKHHREIQRADMDDLVGVAYYELFIYRHNIYDLQKVRAYLVNHLKCRIVDRYRKKCVRLGLQKEIVYLAEETERIGEEQKEDLLPPLYHQIEKLPNAMREVIELNIIKAIPTFKVAEMTNKNRQTILNLRNLAIDKLTRALNPQNNTKRKQIYV